MKISATIHKPQSEAEWQKLSLRLNFGKPNPLLTSMLERARALGCVSLLEEGAYIDRDFSAAYAAFYAQLFKPMSKYCRRLHLFDADIEPAFQGGDPTLIADAVQALSDRYLGDIVLRPLPHAPVSSSRFSASRLLTPAQQEVTVKSRYAVHAFGAEFAIDAMPLAQQDTRTGACAQATMWMAGRHFHNRHAAPWFSMPDITEVALNPTDSGITRSLPAGSEYLTQDNMVRALRAMGRHPVTYVPDAVVNGAQAWQNVRPRDVIMRYVESGIPVIVGLQQPGTGIGHGVVAVGTERTDTRDLSAFPAQPTTGEFVTHFLVSDDQRGPYCRLPVHAADRSADYPFCLETDLKLLLVPLPGKVFLTAETAELVGRDLLKQVATQRVALASRSLGPSSGWDVDSSFYDLVLQDSAVARTYLTYGWKYKARMLRNQCAEHLRKELLALQFPKYVWVTEFGRADELNSLDPCSRQIRAHTVIDASGSRFWDSQLIVDAPGLTVFWQFNPASPSVNPAIVIEASASASPYWAKIRGQKDYAMCAIPGPAA